MYMGLDDLNRKKSDCFIPNEESGKPSGKKKYASYPSIRKGLCLGHRPSQGNTDSSWSSLGLLPSLLLGSGA